MSENQNTQNQHSQNERNNKPKGTDPVAFNILGKSLISGTIILTVNEVKDAILNLANQYFSNVKKDRIRVSLVPDRNTTKYDRATKTSRPTMAVVMAIYFDKNDPNFVSAVENVFAPMVSKNNDKLNQFIKNFGADDDRSGGDGRPYQPIYIEKGADGRAYRCISLGAEKIMAYIMDNKGTAYKMESGAEAPATNVTICPIWREGDNNSLEGFYVTKELVTARRPVVDNFRSTKIRGKVPRI